MATFAEQFESKYKKTGTAQNSFASRFESSDSYKRISENSALRQAEIKHQQDEERKRQALEQAQQFQQQEQQKIEQNKNFIDRIYQKGVEKMPLTTNIMANLGQGIQSFGSKLGKAIMNPAQTVEKASNYLKESPFIKEIPGETQDQANERRAKMALGTYGTAGNIVSDIARVPIRTLGYIGATGTELFGDALQKFTGKNPIGTVNYTPKSPVEKWIYGEGLSSFGQKAVKAEKTIADMGGTDFEVKVLPVLGITAGVFTDLYPGGSAEKKLLSQLAKGGVADVVKIVEKNRLKLSEDAIISIAKSKDTKEIKNILEQEAVKLAQGMEAPVLEPRILKPLELSQETELIKNQSGLKDLDIQQRNDIKTALEQGHSQEAIVKSIQETGEVIPQAPTMTQEKFDQGGTLLRGNEEKASAMRSDIEKTNEYSWKNNVGDKIKTSKGDAIISARYFQDGKPRYSVYPPGKSKSFGYHYWVGENDISSGIKEIAKGGNYTKENIKNLLENNPENKQLNNLVYGVRDFNGDVSNILTDKEKKLVDKFSKLTPKVKTPQIPKESPTYYHGGNPIDVNSIANSDLGLSVSSDKNVANFFANTKENGKISNVKISPNAKILNYKDIPQELRDVAKVDIQGLSPTEALQKMKDAPSIVKENEKRLVAYARKNGYDAIDLSGGDVKDSTSIVDREAELRILNPDIISQSQSPSPIQETKINPLIEEAKVKVEPRVTEEIKPEVEIPLARKADIVIKDKLDKTLEEKAGVLNEGIKNAIKKDKIMQDKAKTAIDIIKEDKTAKPELRNWLKNTYIGKIKAQKEAMDFKIKESADNILKHEAGQNYEGRDVVEKKFQQLYDEAEKAGINIVRRENYVPHLYRESYEEIKKAVAKSMEDKGVDKALIEAYLKGEGLPTEMAKTLKMNPFFTRERSFETYEEAMKYGLTPKYEKISQLVGHYVEKMNEVIANQKLIDDLIASKKLTSKPRYGLKGVDIPNHEGMYFADAKIANHLNDFFRNEDGLNIAQKPLKALAKLSKGLQNIVLAGGIPKSNANFFVAGFLDKELKTAIGSVATGNIKKAVTHLKVLPTFVRSNFIKPSQKFFEKKLENGTLLRMAGQGIDVSNFVGNYKETNRGFIKFFKNTKAKEILGEGYDRVLGEKTFNSFLPMQTTTLFEDTYKQGIKKGLSEEKASKLAGDTVKNYMGIIDQTIGKTTDDFISAFALAPKFREGLINSNWNTVKSIDPRTWKNPAFADNRKLLIGSLIVGFGVYNELNKKLNGHPMSENETGKKLELKIPGKDGKVYYVPFAPSQLAFFRNIVEAGLAVGEGDTKTARQKIGSNLSMGVKLINDIISNQDYFGNEIYDDQAPLREQARDVVKYLGLNANHPYAKGVWNIVVNKNAEKNPIYPKYKEITDLMAKGQREEADLVIAGLTDSEKKEYEDMKKQKLKPTGQVMSEMLEVPLRFTTQGKIESKKRYEKIDKITREIKAIPEDKRTEKIQEIVKNLPEDERKGVVYALGQNGISTKGVSTSETSIRARELAKQWDSLPIKERQRKKIEEIKKDKKFLSAFNQAFEEKDLSQQEIDLKNSTVEERVSYIKNKIKNMGNKEKSLFIAELRKKGIVTDSVFVALRN